MRSRVSSCRYIQNQMKNKTNNSSAKLLLKCIGLCLWCIELCLRYITRNAFIYVRTTAQ